MKVLIAGAGVGGLTTALALHELGIDAEVFEQAREVRELGFGINIMPHAVRNWSHVAKGGFGEAPRRSAIGAVCRFRWAKRTAAFHTQRRPGR